MTDWFARPVLHVKDVESSLRFYLDGLGFTSPWRYDEGDRAHVAQVERQGFSRRQSALLQLSERDCIRQDCWR